MARPPIEWPLPAYVGELRERLVLTYRVPGSALAPFVPTPLHLERVQGTTLVSLCLSAGRCLKPAGRDLVLAAEFQSAELVTPVRWQPACRDALVGLFHLRVLTGSPALGRFLRTALEFGATVDPGIRAPEEAPLPGSSGLAWRVNSLKPDGEPPAWPAGSVFHDPEEAGAFLLRPEWHFFPAAGGEVVRAVPVHQYARSTVPAPTALLGLPYVAAALKVAPDEIIRDHALYQKRCTHTWSFPPERILVTRAPVVSLPHTGVLLRRAA